MPDNIKGEGRRKLPKDLFTLGIITTSGNAEMRKEVEARLARDEEEATT